MKKKLLIMIISIIVLPFCCGCDKDSQNNLLEDKLILNENLKSEDENTLDEIEDAKVNKEENKKQQNEEYIICIDPGHQIKGDMSQEPVGPGSSETKFKVSWGTQGVLTNTPEYELNLQASKKLKSKLEELGFTVIMTRQTNDVSISNSERAIFANENNADLVIRIHADGSEDSSVNGASLLIPSHNGQYTKDIYAESNKCAKLIYDEMINSKFKVNDIYERSDLTGFNWSKVPVVLVEMGFMSNPEEDKKMSDESYQQNMMNSIAMGIQLYFNK